MATSAFVTLNAVTLTAGEQAAVMATTGLACEDAKGMLASAKLELAEVSQKLKRISDNMGAGANKTAIDAYITAALT